MKNKLLIYGSFFVVLVLAFWYFLFKDNDYYKVKLPVLNNVQNFSFTDQDGRTITTKDVEGKVYVTEYFFTTCKGICPKMNENMQKVYSKFRNEKNFMILSHTCMPDTDSIPLMKAYQKKMLGDLPAENSSWHFLTGDKKALYKMARESYLLDNEKNNVGNIEDQFIHTQFFAVVDKQQRVRGIYDGLKQDEIEKLEKDVADLLKETGGDIK